MQAAKSSEVRRESLTLQPVDRRRAGDGRCRLASRRGRRLLAAGGRAAISFGRGPAAEERERIRPPASSRWQHPPDASPPAQLRRLESAANVHARLSPPDWTTALPCHSPGLMLLWPCTPAISHRTRPSALPDLRPRRLQPLAHSRCCRQLPPRRLPSSRRVADSSLVVCCQPPSPRTRATSASQSRPTSYLADGLASLGVSPLFIVLSHGTSVDAVQSRLLPALPSPSIRPLLLSRVWLAELSAVSCNSSTQEFATKNTTPLRRRPRGPCPRRVELSTTASWSALSMRAASTYAHA